MYTTVQSCRYWSCTRSACFFCQAEDGIRDLVRSRGVGDVYKRQVRNRLKVEVVKSPVADVADVDVSGLDEVVLGADKDGAEELI